MYTYKEFKQDIANNNTIPRYYITLVSFTEEILLDIANNKQSLVASYLGLTPVKLSHILPLLKELYYHKHDMHNPSPKLPPYNTKNTKNNSKGA